MASVKSLMGAGMPGLQSRLVGATIQTLAGAGTAQGTATAIGNVTCVLATTASGQTAFVLPADAEIGRVIEFYTVSATTALVFPDTGSQLNGGTATTGNGTVAQNKGAIFRKVAAGQWRSVAGA